MQLAPNGNIYISGFVPLTILNPNQSLESNGLKTRMYEAPQKAHKLPKVTHLLPLSLAYEGETVAVYTVYRGSSASNMRAIDSLPGNVYTYTDLNPVVGEELYQIGTSFDTDCNSGKSINAGVKTSKSNIRTKSIVGIKESPAKSFTLYPNPSNGIIQMSGVKNGAAYRIIDVLGKTQTTGIFEDENAEVQLHTLPSGLYFMVVEGSKEVKRFEIRK
jgi:hypothetical protein